MKYTFKLIFALIMFLIPVGHLSSEEIQGAKKIDSNQAHKLIEDNANNPDFVILDVRTPGEYNSGHIENAVNVDYKSESFKDEVNKLDNNKTYAVYCHSGRRAAASADIMEQLGFKSIFEIGGVKQWQEAGYELTPPENK